MGLEIDLKNSTWLAFSCFCCIFLFWNGSQLWSQEFDEIPDLEDIDFGEIEDEEGEGDDSPFWGEDATVLWDFHGSSNHLRKNHPLNPEEQLFSFSNGKVYTGVDIEWNPSITESLTFRSHQAFIGFYEEDVHKTEAFFQESFLEWINEEKTIVLNAGRVQLEWGSGYHWNPTQVLLPYAQDPQNDFEEDTGVGMFLAEYSISRVTSTLLVGQYSGKTEHENPVQYAAKFSFNFDPWEIALVHHQATEVFPTYGLSFTGLLTDSLELHGEWTTTQKRDRKRPTLMNPMRLLRSGFTIPGQYDYLEDEQKSYTKSLIGLQYTLLDDMSLIVEYYDNGHGYSDDEWKTIEMGVNSALHNGAWDNRAFNSERGNPYEGFLKNTMEIIDQDDVRQHYLFVRLETGVFKEIWQWEQVAIANLDDQSQVHRSKLKLLWDSSLEMSLRHTIFQGEELSEFGLIPYAHKSTFEITKYF